MRILFGKGRGEIRGSLRDMRVPGGKQHLGMWISWQAANNWKLKEGSMSWGGGENRSVCGERTETNLGETELHALDSASFVQHLRP